MDLEEKYKEIQQAIKELGYISGRPDPSFLDCVEYAEVEKKLYKLIQELYEYAKEMKSNAN
jgi:DNA polymerase III delta subunit